MQRAIFHSWFGLALAALRPAFASRRPNVAVPLSDEHYLLN
jgi:hypothetical protein